MRIFPKVEILDSKEFEKMMTEETLANKGLADFPDVACKKLWDEFVGNFYGFYSQSHENIYMRNGYFCLHNLVHEFIHHVGKKLNLYNFLGDMLHKLEYRKGEPIEISIYLDGDSNRD